MSTTTKPLADLAANPDNPRTISPKKLTMLAKALAKFGDLSGVVFNRRSKLLVGGHQRVKTLSDALENGQVVITRQFDEPSPTGTVATGYIEYNGEQHPYREVDWAPGHEKAANLAANRGAGEWDQDKLKVWMKDLKDMDFDLDLTMFDTFEVLELDSPAQGDGDAGDDALSLLPEGKGESTSGVDGRHLAIGRLRVPLTQDEEEALIRSVKDYETKFGMLFGYASHLLDGALKS